jgi:hypothetical protein
LLVEAYAELERGRRPAEAVENLDEIEIDANAPKDLQDQVRKYLKRYPEARWDAALSAIVEIGSNRRTSRTRTRR